MDFLDMLHEYTLSTPYSFVLTHDPILEISYPGSQPQSRELRSASPFVVLPKLFNAPAPPARGEGMGDFPFLNDPDSGAFLYPFNIFILSSAHMTSFYFLFYFYFS